MGISDSIRVPHFPLRVLVQTAKGIGDNGIWRLAKLNGILYLPGRWFEDDIILLCLRWYFRFKLSYRDLVAIFR